MRPSERNKTHSVQKQVFMLLRAKDIGFSEPCVQHCRFPHHFILLSTKPLYYAAMFLEGGGIDNAEAYIPYTMVHVVI